YGIIKVRLIACLYTPFQTFINLGRRSYCFMKINMDKGGCYVRNGHCCRRHQNNGGSCESVRRNKSEEYRRCKQSESYRRTVPSDGTIDTYHRVTKTTSSCIYTSKENFCCHVRRQSSKPEKGDEGPYRFPITYSNPGSCRS